MPSEPPALSVINPGLLGVRDCQGMMVASPPGIKYCCVKSLLLIRSIKADIADPAKVLSEHRRQVLRSNFCRSNKQFGASYHFSQLKVNAVTSRPLKIKPHFSSHTMAGEGEFGSFNIDIGGSTAEVVGAPGVTETDTRRAINSVPFKQWLSNLKSKGGILTPAVDGGASCSLKRITVQSVDMFGQRVGFVKFKAEVVDSVTGKMLPGVVFARGGAVGILMLLTCDGEKYAVLTEQARVPVGRVILELPAGMLDDDAGDFVGTAAREVEEETGIHIKTSDLISLTDFLNVSTGQKMFPSPGGCDEEVSLMLYRSHVKREVVDSLKGRQTGLQDHGEFIKVRIVPYNALWRSTADSKVLAAITLYEMAKREGALQAPPNAPEISNL